MARQSSNSVWHVPSWCFPLLIVLAGIAVYANSFQGEFIYDDQVHIYDNDRITQLWPPWAALHSRRPIVDLSLAVNYALGGFSVGGYHAFNLGVHLLAALTLFGVLRRTLSLPKCTLGTVTAASGIAGSVALLWVVHPLQTQAVTYVTQRGECMMGLFYLLTLYCLLRSVDSAAKGAWQWGAVGCCTLGMGTKGVMVTAPVMVLLFDWIFLSASLREIWRRRWTLYVGLMATWSVLFATGLVWGVFNPAYLRDRAVGFGIKDFGPLEYLLTQPGVIVHYIKLALWPHPLCFDYGWQPAQTMTQVIVPLLVILMAVGFSIWAVIKKRPAGFLGIWFFLILAPTSSFIPIRDMLVEHRMYLSLAAVMTVVVFLGRGVVRRFADLRGLTPAASLVLRASLVAVAVLALGATTIRRNMDYRSEESIWRDVVTKRPGNPRGQLNFGNVTDNPDEALLAYQKAIELKPDYADGYYNLGTQLARKGDDAAAEKAYRRAIELDRDFAEPHFNLGNALDRMGRKAQAMDAYREALRISPDYVRAHYNLGTSLYSLGEIQASIEQFRDVLRLLPAWRGPGLVAETHFNLGTALTRLGSEREAAGHFRAVLKIKPGHAGARRSLTKLGPQFD